MAAMPLCKTSLAPLKYALRTAFPHVKSSHLSEALAASLGFRTHAALLAAMTEPGADRTYILLDESSFHARLTGLGYPQTNDPIAFEPDYVGKGVIATRPDGDQTKVYTSLRNRAWRNLLVCTINAGLAQNHFSLRPGDNRFASSDGGGAVFDFTLPNGLPVRGGVSDGGFDELMFRAIVNPKGSPIDLQDLGFEDGDVLATGWLERREGAWLQGPSNSLQCRAALLSEMASLQVDPHGFGDRGPVML